MYNARGEHNARDMHGLLWVDALLADNPASPCTLLFSSAHATAVRICALPVAPRSKKRRLAVIAKRS